MSRRRAVYALGAIVLLLGGCDDPTPDAVEPVTAPTSTAAAAPPDDEPSTTMRPELAGTDDAVLFVGDSLTVGAASIGGLEGRLRTAGFDDVDIIAEEGRDTAWGLGEIEDLDAVPPVVVVELGTNRSGNPEGFPDEVDEVIAALRSRGAVHIAWITPVFATDDRYQEKVDILRAATGIDLVGDWAEVVHNDPDLLSSDGLHPTEPGYGRLARFLTTTAAEVADG